MNSVNRRDNSRHVKAPTGPELTCKHWGAEAPMRMLMNNLDDAVAENPQELCSRSLSSESAEAEISKVGMAQSWQCSGT